MKQNRHFYCVAALVAVAAWLAFAGQALAQQIPDLPDFVKQATSGLRGPDGKPVQSMMITNDDFKRFKPTFEYDPKTGMVPVVVTEREAQDYVAWTGKRMGIDYMWRAIPRSKKGVIQILSSDLFDEQRVDTSAMPAAPSGMVYVPEGAFIMGSDNGDPDEAPKHNEAAGPFFIDKFEVSNGEYKQAFPDFKIEPGHENFPAVVTWEQANAYAAKVGKRLPTEPEWEKADRGTDGRMFPWGDSFDPSFVCWDEKDPRGGAIARPESPYGCIDMAGSVWEWTADWYKPYPGNTSPSDEYGEKYKVIRGGGSFNDISMFRASYRGYLAPKTTGHMRVGFRCAKDYKP